MVVLTSRSEGSIHHLLKSVVSVRLAPVNNIGYNLFLRIVLGPVLYLRIFFREYAHITNQIYSKRKKSTMVEIIDIHSEYKHRAFIISSNEWRKHEVYPRNLDLHGSNRCDVSNPKRLRQRSQREIEDS